MKNRPNNQNALVYVAFAIVILTTAVPLGTAQENSLSSSTNTISGVKLLWTKTFKTPIDSVKIVGNGDKIAVALAPFCIKKSTTTTLWYRGGNTGLERICSDGHLELYNRNGDFLWRYPAEAKKGSSFIGTYNIEASLDGKYFAASVSQRPCKMIKATLTLDSDWEGDDPTWHINAMSCNWAVDLVSETGKLIWRKPLRSVAKFMPDNRHVLLLPYPWRKWGVRSYPEPFPHFVGVVDMSGKEIWKEESKNIFKQYKPGYVATSPWFQFMSRDGHRFVIGSSLYEWSGKEVKRLPFTGSGVGISRDGNYVLSCLHRTSLWDVAASTDVWESDGDCGFTNLNEQTTIGDDDSFRYFQFNQVLIAGDNIFWPKEGLSVHNTKTGHDGILIGGKKGGTRWIYSSSGTVAVREEQDEWRGGMHSESYEDWSHNLTGYRLPDGKLEWWIPKHDFFNLSDDGRLIAAYPSMGDTLKLEIYENQNH